MDGEPDVRYVSSESAQESHERLMAAKGGNISYETFAKREREVMGIVLPRLYLKRDRRQAWHRGAYGENIYSKGHEEIRG